MLWQKHTERFVQFVAQGEMRLAVKTTLRLKHRPLKAVFPVNVLTQKTVSMFLSGNSDEIK
jgi:hypothetical protein